ncbi:hypothetical protein C8Q76DRAFT_697832 [Earliella scabrosa]|nr:hypothetical protein C8Q76DRAFT_697832 [Earliella scabrosa]
MLRPASRLGSCMHARLSAQAAVIVPDATSLTTPRPASVDANIYLHGDTYSLLRGRSIATLWMTIEDEERTDHINFLLPTPDHAYSTIPPWLCQGWMVAIQSERMQHLGLSERQREILLDFTLLYHAFVAPHPDAHPSLFAHILNALVQHAQAHDPYARADSVLAAVVEWAHTHLPETLFVDPVVVDGWDFCGPDGRLADSSMQPSHVSKKNVIQIRGLTRAVDH